MKLLKVKKVLSAVLAGAMMLSVASCGSSSTSGSSDDPIKVGVLFSLTGSNAVIEQAPYNAAMMAIDEINAAGGINGRQIEAVHEDYNSDPQEAAEKFKKLAMKDEVVATVGLFTSASRIACETVAKENDSVLFYPTSYEGEAPAKNIIYTGSVLPTQQAPELVPWLIEEYGPKFYMVGTDTVFAQTIDNQCRGLLKQFNGIDAGEDLVPSGHEDFASIITKIKEADPDVIYANLNGSSAISFYKQYKQYGLNPDEMPIVSYVADESIFAAAGADSAKGHMVAINYVNTMETEANKKFVADYTEKYGEEYVLTAMGESAYISVYALKKALESSEDWSADGITSAIAGMEIDAPEGKVKFDEENNHLWLPCRIAECDESGMPKVIFESDLKDPNPTLEGVAQE